MDDPASYFLASLIDSVPHSNTLLKILAKLCAVFFFVGANAFFVAAEFALVSVRRPRLEARAAAGSRRAQAALRLLADPTSFISATQLGITIASLALGWIGEPTIALVLEPIAARIASVGRAGYVAHLLAIILAFAAITFLHIVLGELMPKMFALERAEGFALFAARPLEIFAKIFQWPLWVFNRTGTFLGRLIGLKSSLQHSAVYSEAELRQLIDISRESGHLRAEERRLIHRVFEFSDTLVREAMVPRPAIAAISADCSLEAITQAFQQHRYSRLPVYRGSLDNVIGFIHSKDLIPYLLRPQDFSLEHVLQSPMYVVDTARLEDVLRQMQKAKTHFGFVVDEHGGIEGIITLEDLLEEIVGDISDEHDEEVNEQINPVDERTFLLDGSLAVRDLNRRLKTSIPESEAYTTIGGFLMTVAGHVLQPGEVIEHDGLRFHIEKVERRRLLRVRLELRKDENGQPAEGASSTANAAG
ncbi:MAG: magnesium and cobalt exporter, family [Blastocatellia bacterium]|jgi:CBS domain containing-hemolysin-like protein|nr:magnesium and cobalt exporter, family [Blastocatellia bacterium]